MWKFLPRRNTALPDLVINKGQVFVNGRSLTLPYKPNQVLLAILSSAPKSVSRETLITDIWEGNFLTGEKALTQALWIIRSTLSENGYDPDWIRTRPRYGYEWVGPDVRQNPSKGGQPLGQRFPLTLKNITPVAMILSLGLAILGIPETVSFQNAGPLNTSEPASQGVPTHAYFEDGLLVVRHIEGCIFLFRADPGKQLVSPVISADGTKLAVNVLKSNECKLKVFDFKTRSTETFDRCMATNEI